jgi:hypothetical protein
LPAFSGKFWDRILKTDHDHTPSSSSFISIPTLNTINLGLQKVLLCNPGINSVRITLMLQKEVPWTVVMMEFKAS